MTSTELEAAPSQQQSVDREGSVQLVSFRLAGEEYGIEINKVREIILATEITQVPQVRPYVKGLINLRSTVIPIIDLSLRFGLAEADRTDDTRIVVVSVNDKTIGIIVDAVSEVLRVSREQLAPPPPTINGLEQGYITGLARLEKRLLILLDIEKILCDDNAFSMEELVAGAAAAAE